MDSIARGGQKVRSVKIRIIKEKRKKNKNKAATKCHCFIHISVPRSAGTVWDNTEFIHSSSQVADRAVVSSLGS